MLEYNLNEYSRDIQPGHTTISFRWMTQKMVGGSKGDKSKVQELENLGANLQYSVLLYLFLHLPNWRCRESAF